MAPRSRLSRARKRSDRGLNGQVKRKADAISSDEPPLHEDDEGAKLTWFDILENGASKQQARGSNDSFKPRGPYSGDSNRTKRRKKSQTLHALQVCPMNGLGDWLIHSQKPIQTSITDDEC